MRFALPVFFVAIAALLVAQDDGKAKIEWKESWKAAQEVAKKEKRLVAVYFSGSRCPWCRRFEHGTLSDGEVARIMNETFVPCRPSGEEARGMAKKYHVRGVPHTLFLTAAGEEVMRIRGYVDVPLFKLMAARAEKAGAALTAVAEAPEDASKRVALGEAMRVARQYERAEKEFKKAAELDADNEKGAKARALFDLAELYTLFMPAKDAEVKERAEKVLETLKELEKLDPKFLGLETEVSLMRLMAGLMAKMEEKDPKERAGELRKELGAYLEKYPKTRYGALLKLHLAQANYTLGDKNKAIEWLERIVKEHPGTEEAYISKRALDRLKR